MPHYLLHQKQHLIPRTAKELSEESPDNLGESPYSAHGTSLPYELEHGSPDLCVIPSSDRIRLNAFCGAGNHTVLEDILDGESEDASNIPDAPFLFLLRRAMVQVAAGRSVELRKEMVMEIHPAKFNFIKTAIIHQDYIEGLPGIIVNNMASGCELCEKNDNACGCRGWIEKDGI